MSYYLPPRARILTIRGGKKRHNETNPAEETVT